jgi:hypothetical protein
MSAEFPMPTEPAESEGAGGADHERGRTSDEDGSELTSTAHVAFNQDLVSELARRSNGTKTPPVDAAAIVAGIGRVLKDRGLVDSTGHLVKDFAGQ